MCPQRASAGFSFISLTCSKPPPPRVFLRGVGTTSLWTQGICNKTMQGKNNTHTKQYLQGSKLFDVFFIYRDISKYNKDLLALNYLEFWNICKPIRTAQASTILQCALSFPQFYKQKWSILNKMT